MEMEWNSGLNDTNERCRRRGREKIEKKKGKKKIKQLKSKRGRRWEGESQAGSFGGG